MSNTADRRERISAMKHMALAQNVLGQGLRMGHGMVGGEEEEPAYITDDAPVLHVRCNKPQHEPDFNLAKALYRNDSPDREVEWTMTERCLEVKRWVREQ